MGIFDWLFGRTKQTSDSSGLSGLNQSELGKPSKEELDDVSPSKAAVLDESSVKLLRKRLREEKKSLSNEEFVSLASEIFSDNTFLFNDCISLVKQVVPSFKKFKSWSNDDIINFIQEQVLKCPESLDVKEFEELAYTYSKVDVNVAIKFCEDIIKVQKDKDIYGLATFPLVLALSKYHLDAKRGDIAFKTVREAGLLITDFTDQIKHVEKHIRICSMYSYCCFHGYSQPKYADFLYWELCEFLFQVADKVYLLNESPWLFRFEKECYKEDDDNFLGKYGGSAMFDEALKDLGGYDSKRLLLDELYEYAFTKMPVALGLPINLIDQTTHRNWLKSRSSNDAKQFQEVNDGWDNFMARPFNLAVIHDVVNPLLLKYCSKE